MSSAPVGGLGGRDRILNAALHLFGEQGFAPTSVRQVAVAAGVSPPLVLHHFGSKDGLRRAVDADVMRRVERALDGALAELPARLDITAPRDRIAARLLTSQGPLVLDASLRTHVRRSILEGGPAGAALLSKAWQVAAKQVHTLKASGLARPELDTQETTLHLLLLVFGPWLLIGLDDILEEPASSPAGSARRLRAGMALLTHGVLAAVAPGLRPAN